MAISNIELKNLEQDLNWLYEQVRASCPNPPQKYLDLFKKRYSRYNSDRVSSTRICRRYIKELTLILFFLGLLKKQNPRFQLEIPYLTEYYTLPNLDLNLSYFPSKEDIPEAYLVATKIVLLKDDKYFCEFYTPVSIANILVDSVDSADLNPKKTFLDPCCGPGSLLSILLIRLIERNCTTNELNEFISKSLFGYDILPFSVIISFLQICSIHQFYTNNSKLPSVFNIYLKDSLRDNSDQKFSYILTNPPYKKTLNDLEIISKYKDVIFGHPNMYLLFLLWGLERITDDGHLIYLVPQTLRVGLYNHKFRDLIGKKYFLNLIGVFEEKTNVFPEVEQKVMILDLAKKPIYRQLTIEYYRKHDGTDPTTLRLPFSEVSHHTASTNYWQIPTSKLTLDIINKIKRESRPMDSFQSIKIGAGNYVWNQHKPELRKNYSGNTLPLLYADSIGRYLVSLPDGDSDDNRLKYSKKIASIRSFSDPAVLIKRTTTTEMSGKICASLLESTFLRKYGACYLENHLLYLQTSDIKLKLQYPSLVCYLNSSLLNYYFNSVSATSHISTYEFRAMPLSVSLIYQIKPTADRFFDTKRETYLEDIDERIYNYFRLSSNEIKEVKRCIKRRAI